MRSKEVEEGIELLKNEILLIKEGLEKGWYYGERYNLEQEVKKKETVLSYISKLEKEITVLENTKNICPVINTSGIKCDLKRATKPFYHIERKKDVDG